MLHSFRAALTEARRHGDLYFAALVDRQSISAAFGEASSLWQGWIYTPAVTVWVFLSQCLSTDHSCRDAVARLAAWRAVQGAKPCSADTGAYCTARDALPEAVCRELVRRSGRELEAQAPPAWFWRGRRVRVVDGTTISMPDTPENQAEYPQAKTQVAGCGLPIARVLVVFSLAVGTVIEATLGPYKGKQTGENSLFRTLHHTLSEGDMVLLPSSPNSRTPNTGPSEDVTRMALERAHFFARLSVPDLYHMGRLVAARGGNKLAIPANRPGAMSKSHPLPISLDASTIR